MTRVIAALSVVLAFTGPLFAGPLTPPAGPIAPTPGPEPRVAINAANTRGDADATPSMFKITQPGSYYLTGNITGASGKAGIEVASSDVTIDLMGFELLGVPGSGAGISVTSSKNLTVRNGTVRSWGGSGLNAAGGTDCATDYCLE